ncbi:hypothetical protein NFI96_008138 [Prochilodus magdalenae]|nr:hypothetical protein NFI96_008138 [Prochilodus magdalenae]
MKSQDYPGILERNGLPSVRKLGLSRRSWVLQQDNEPKHTSKNTQEWLRGKHWTILKWPSMSPDLNPIEHVWKQLRPSNLRQLEQFAHEEWAKIPAERCRSLIDRYRNRLIAVIASKVVLHNYTVTIADPFDSSCSCTYEGIDAITGARWMKLSVLLMFLLVLAPSSGIRCDRAYNNQNGYNDFLKKHILSEDFPINPIRKDLNDIFEKYLQDHDLCGRVDLQTFFDRSNTDRYARPNVPTVESICNGKGFEHGNNDGNLCISERKIPVYMVKRHSKKFGYINFSTKHILPKGFGVNSQEKWENYLNTTKFNNKPLCERETPDNLQTFFEHSSESKVKKICNGDGYERAGGEGDLCISEKPFKVYMLKIKMENNQCKVDNIKSDKLYVVVGCENVYNKCLPGHFHGQVNNKGTAPWLILK